MVRTTDYLSGFFSSSSSFFGKWSKRPSSYETSATGNDFAVETAVDLDSSVAAVLGFAAGFFSGAASTASFVFLSGARGATPSSTSYPLRTCTSILSFLISSSISLGDL